MAAYFVNAGVGDVLEEDFEAASYPALGKAEILRVSAFSISSRPPA